MLEIVLVFVEDLSVCLSDMFTKHGYGFIPSLMIESQQVHSKLIVDVLCNRFSFIVLFSRLDAIFLVLNPTCHA